MVSKKGNFLEGRGKRTALGDGTYMLKKTALIRTAAIKLENMRFA